MSFKKELLLMLLDIKCHLQTIHNEAECQTNLLASLAGQPKKAAPDPKTITWQEAVKTLRDLCQNQDCCDDCVAREWCDRALPVFSTVSTPNCWEVPADE